MSATLARSALRPTPLAPAPAPESAQQLGQPLAQQLAALAVDCLLREVETYPKPGLVSHVDAGAHADMDVTTLRCSAAALAPCFAQCAELGLIDASLAQLRSVGLAGERAMLAATAGVNSHRGAIFGLGLLVAAAGVRASLAAARTQTVDLGRHRPPFGAAAQTRQPRRAKLPTLGTLVAERWGAQILAAPVGRHSHGAAVARRYGAGGARLEAAAGFPSVYRCGLPALRAGRLAAADDEEAARVHACMALLAQVEDTNLLHRGGPAGLAFARAAARRYLAAGSVATADWRARGARLHRQFVARGLSPGGCADLLAMTLFVDRLEPA